MIPLLIFARESLSQYYPPGYGFQYYPAYPPAGANIEMVDLTGAQYVTPIYPRNFFPARASNDFYKLQQVKRRYNRNNPKIIKISVPRSITPHAATFVNGFSEPRRVQVYVPTPYARSDSKFVNGPNIKIPTETIHIPSQLVSHGFFTENHEEGWKSHYSSIKAGGFGDREFFENNGRKVTGKSQVTPGQPVNLSRFYNGIQTGIYSPYISTPSAGKGSRGFFNEEPKADPFFSVKSNEAPKLVKPQDGGAEVGKAVLSNTGVYAPVPIQWQ